MDYTIFGESHGPAIGVVLEDVPAGVELDLDLIAAEMARRAPGKSPLSTPRKETDQPEILSGLFEGRTTGTPLCAIIRNSDQHSKDYAATKNLARPGHADYTGHVRYHGCNDYRGGGHFSGRLTAPLVFAGAIAKQVLEKEQIEVLAHIKNIGSVCDAALDYAAPDVELLRKIKSETLPLLDRAKAAVMENEILAAKSEADSVGGAVEAVVIGLKPGMGSPFFESVESRIAQILFSVPAVKAVEFGIGTSFSQMRGSQANDPFYIQNGEIKTKTNHNGGINGGITNGMPVVVTAAIKPTPSIGKPQETVNIKEMKESTYSTHGRHDPCIVQRAVPVIEAALAVAVLDMLLEEKTYAGTI